MHQEEEEQYEDIHARAAERTRALHCIPDLVICISVERKNGGCYTTAGSVYVHVLNTVRSD